MKWKTLPSKDLKHLRTVAGVNSLKQFKVTAAHHAKMRVLNPNIEPCWECRFIAQKLGLEI